MHAGRHAQYPRGGAYGVVVCRPRDEAFHQPLCWLRATIHEHPGATGRLAGELDDDAAAGMHDGHNLLVRGTRT